MLTARGLSRLFVGISAIALFVVPARESCAAYVARKLVGGLNQPTFVTAAPGDNNNLYIVQRAGTGNTVGDIVRYNKITGVTSSYFNVPGSLVQDGGLLGMAFHPDFPTNGLIYVSSLVGTNSRLEEYQVPTGGGTPTLRRTVLDYVNPRTQHTIGWIGFKPNATGAERNNLYISTGDGGIQADSSNGTFVNNGQDPTTIMGKLLRLSIDPGAADSYPGDASRNYAIPTDNPFIADVTGKAKEILHTGLRNPWRASFDKLTGDLYIGDVGFNTKEEIDFVKNDANFLASRDFGWGKREGTIANPVAGIGAASPGSINPIFEVNQDVFQSMTGGFLYRGPVPELQGKYLFGDFVTSRIFGINFDRDTDPLSFNGATAGVSNFQDMTPIINTLISINGGGGPIAGLVSFGEDNAGNLYVIDFGGARGDTSFNNDYPNAGTGEIFKLVAVPEPSAALLLAPAALLFLRRRRRTA